jgi:hypothetical protein
MIIIDGIRSVYRANMTAILAPDAKLETFANDPGTAGTSSPDNSVPDSPPPMMSSPYGAPPGPGGSAGFEPNAGGDQSASPDAGPAGNQRGFILTVRCTTPYEQGVRLIDQTFIQNLLAIKPGAIPLDKPYYIAKAGFARRDYVRNDTQLMSKLQADYNLRAQQAAQPAVPGGPPGGGPPMGGAMFNPGSMGGPAAGNSIPEAAFQDPILHEDVRDDLEATIVIAIVLDPPPPPAPAAKP